MRVAGSNSMGWIEVVRDWGGRIEAIVQGETKCNAVEHRFCEFTHLSLPRALRLPPRRQF